MAKSAHSHQTIDSRRDVAPARVDPFGAKPPSARKQDHFKEINDTYGHAAGDACLGAIIGPIQAELRQSDVIGRYGGEEFVVILSSADAAAAHPIAERILERVAHVQVEGFGRPIRLTCSIGVAASDTLGVWGEHLIARADAAVYVAKKSGRNRVQIAMPLAA